MRHSRSSRETASLAVSLKKLLGLGVGASHLHSLDQKARGNVRWLGLVFGPGHLLFLYTDMVVRPDVSTAIARIPIAVILFVSALITFLPLKRFPYRYLWHIHILTWCAGQSVIFYLLGGSDLSIFTIALILLVGGILVYYQPYKYLLTNIATVVTYLLIYQFAFNRPPFETAQLPQTMQLLISAMAANLIAIIGFNRGLRESGYLEAINKQKTQLEKANQQLNSELMLAEKIQQRLLPARDLDSKLVRFDFSYLPVHNVGGDMIDFTQLDSTRFAVLIADVSGHGVASALISSMLKTQYLSYGHEMLANPVALVTLLNRDLNPILEREFITLVYGVIDAQKKEINYVAAGHDHPVVIKNNGQAINPEKSSRAIGLSVESEFSSQSIQLESGDRIYFYTDGCYEFRTENTDIQENEQNWQNSLRNAQQLPFEKVNYYLIDEIVKRHGVSELQDDISFIFCEIY